MILFYVPFLSAIDPAKSCQFEINLVAHMTKKRVSFVRLSFSSIAYSSIFILTSESASFPISSSFGFRRLSSR